MKKLLTTSLVILTVFSCFAQVPQKMSYQCVVRNTNGALVINQSVGIRISILQGTITGTIVYQETYNPNPQTNANGLLSLEIGGGLAITGTFSEIDWSSGPYFLKTETDPAGGTNYTIIGISQLLSVPYAMYAKTAGNSFSGNYYDLTNKPVLFSGNYNDLTNTPILFNGTWGSLTGKPLFAAVSISGNYNDLINKPILFNGSWTNIVDKPTTIAGYGITDAVMTSGDQNILGHKIFNGITTIISPVNSTDAANKVYVDSLKQKIKILEDNLISAGTYKFPDIDGNTYKTVQIGSQVWMAENLKTTKFNDGTPIALATDSITWTFSATPGYCWYNNDVATYKDSYGALYNWQAVNTGKLCPKGWHVPSLQEWLDLSNYLGPSVAGGKLKEAGTVHWASPNTGATNDFGFTALPGGGRAVNFAGIGTSGSWWSSTEDTHNSDIYFTMSYSSINLSQTRDSPYIGKSVRCLQGEGLPTITTVEASSITQSTAISGGNITSDGGASITARGVCWNTSTMPTTDNSKTSDGVGSGSFTSSLTGLSTNTKYFVRAYTTNTLGTVYGNEISFNTLSPGITVTDNDGNIYNTINIGTQVWMRENLKTTKYNDGTKILLITDNITWGNNFSAAYCWYNNDSLTYKSSYGALYNWKAVNTGNLCPIGWHLPSSSEWSTLFTYLGGSTAGGKLKETGTAHWNSPNTGATNESGFTALPGGTRLSSFSDIGNSGSWWSSTNDPFNYPWGWQITDNSDIIGIPATGIPRQVGCSIRCLKD